MDRTFGKDNEDYYSNLESIPSTKRVISSKLSSSTLSDKFFQDEEEPESSTQSIRIEESLHEVTPSPDAPEVHEISDISYSHIYETKEDIRISYIEEKHCCTSIQTFTGDFPLNSVQNLPIIVVKENVLWLGFKRPSTYWGWKRDAQCSESIDKQVSEMRKVHTWITEGCSKLSLQSSSCSSRSKRPAKQVIPSSNHYDHI